MMYTVDIGIISSEARDARLQEWFTPLLFDAAYLNAVCFMTQAFFDRLLGRSGDQKSRLRHCKHYGKAIKALQGRLQTEEDLIKFSNSTIRTVLAFWGHAYTTGDNMAAIYHGSGLLHLVSLRGVHALFHDTVLLTEVLRYVRTLHYSFHGTYSSMPAVI